jgi:hypothetical protein
MKFNYPGVMEPHRKSGNLDQMGSSEVHQMTRNFKPSYVLRYIIRTVHRIFYVLHKFTLNYNTGIGIRAPAMPLLFNIY